MIVAKLNNYVPKDIQGKRDEWDISFVEGESFTATSTSRNGMVTCTYHLDRVGESTVIVLNNSHKKIINDTHRTISQNNGNGSVQLRGGDVSKRFGNFRREVFQDFMTKFNISSVKSVTEYGFNSAYIIENNDAKKSRVIIPTGGSFSAYCNKSEVVLRKIDRPASVTASNAGSIKIVNVWDAKWWIYEEETEGRKNRKLYCFGKQNILSIQDEIESVLKI